MLKIYQDGAVDASEYDVDNDPVESQIPLVEDVIDVEVKSEEQVARNWDRLTMRELRQAAAERKNHLAQIQAQEDADTRKKLLASEIAADQSVAAELENFNLQSKWLEVEESMRRAYDFNPESSPVDWTPDFPQIVSSSVPDYGQGFSGEQMGQIDFIKMADDYIRKQLGLDDQPPVVIQPAYPPYTPPAPAPVPPVTTVKAGFDIKKYLPYALGFTFVAAVVIFAMKRRKTA